MLIATSISKTYTPKKGPAVQALKNVSVTLGDRGLVFILGKSGSGKSTLLNVLGGLDSYDSGEIVIKGKSSKDFKQSEFDSYRNTFIGFIFQEYNILNEFTVGQNIALAIELQGRKASSEEVNAILEEVDLRDYANRKPNELSGGQKQRVAIARALIKKPEIIMADEPTGALDSNTGKMIFDTLKKLAETKLVVVVSHDRDFAEQYGDRVIELADGEIISDITKHTVSPDARNSGVSVVDDRIIRIKKGYTLTAEDISLIAEYIQKSGDDTYISLDTRTNEEVKRAARITAEGDRETFTETTAHDTVTKEYKAEDFSLIKSRLPYKNAVKIGASGLRAKPMRLLMTILLSAVAFCLFGIAMTAADYNKAETAQLSLTNEQINYMAWSKEQIVDGGNYSYTNDTQLTEGDLAMLQERFGDDLIPVYIGTDSYASNNYDSYLKDRSKMTAGSYGMNYYQSNIRGLVEASATQLDTMGYTVTGRLPTSDSEIAITQYEYEIFKLCGYRSADGLIEATISTENDIIGKTIGWQDYGKSADVSFVIVGVVDTKINTTRYDAMKPSADSDDSTDTPSDNTTVTVNSNSMGAQMLAMEMESFLKYSLHSVGFVNEGYLTATSSAKKYDANAMNTNLYLASISGDIFSAGEFSSMNCSYIIDYSSIPSSSVVLFSGALADNQILVTADNLSAYYSSVGTSAQKDFINGLPNNWDALNDYMQSADGLELGQTMIDNGYPLTPSAFSTISNGEETKYSLTYTQSASGMYYHASDSYEWDANGDYYVAGYDEDYMPTYRPLTELDKRYRADGEGGYDEAEDGEYMYVDGAYITIERYRIVANYHMVDVNTPSDALRYDFSYEEDVDGTFYMNKENIGYYIVTYLNGEGYAENAYAAVSGADILSAAVTEYVNAKRTAGEIPEFSVNLTKVKYSNEMTYESSTVYVAGIYFGGYSDVVMTTAKIEDLALRENGTYSCVVGPMPTTEEGRDAMLAFWEDDGDETVNYQLRNSVTTALINVGGYLETFTTVFLYIGLGCAIFAAFLLMTFITTSISYKRSEIGILRAVGARSADVVNIFFNESLIIALINYFVALIGTFGAVMYINSYIKTSFNLTLTLMNFGFLQALYMLLIAVAVAFLASAIPVIAVARKKPIDAIRDR